MKYNIFPTPLLKGGIIAFTLVELIVVVTILAILGTIGFVSYSSYLTGVRDANRTSQLAAISDGLHLYSTTNTLPTPDNSVNITSDGDIDNTVGYQGYAGTTVLEIIDYSKQGLDPKDKTHFTYYLTADKKHHQLLAFLEESENLQAYHSLFPQAHASLENRYPTVYGKKLGVIVDAINTPIQEVVSGNLNLSDASTSTYKAYYKDSQAPVTGGTNLAASAPNASCKRIYDTTGARRDGVYEINPTGTTAFDVYCDMTTDGGGWTLVANIQEPATPLTDSIYTNGLGTPNLSNLNTGEWVLDIDTYVSAGEKIRINMGEISDFFRPISSSDFREMLLSSDKHEWSPDGISFQAITYHGNNGGSGSGWPSTNISGDSRSYLSFWGGNGSQAGGCCGYTKTSVHDGWNKKFQMWMK